MIDLQGHNFFDGDIALHLEFKSQIIKENIPLR